MRLLIISYYYNPINTPRALRWQAIAEELAKNNYQIDIVTVDTPHVKDQPQHNKEKINIHRISNILLKRKDPNNTNSISFKKNKARFSVKLINLIKSCLRSLIWPDITFPWCISSMKTIKKLVKARDYDAIISVSLPFTGHILGAYAKRLSKKAVWIMDIGDPFCIIPNNGITQNKLYQQISQHYEKKFLYNCDAISVTNSNLAEAYQKKFPRVKNKIHVLPPVITLKIPKTKEQPRDNSIKIAFFGRLYKKIRSPKMILAWLDSMLKIKNICRLELHFYGAIDECIDEFDPYKNLIGHYIFFHGEIDRDNIAEKMLTSDVLVNLGNSSEFQVPSKLVEYMLTGKPIINFSTIQEDSSLKLLKECKYERLIDINNTNANALHNIEEIKKLWDKIIKMHELPLLNTENLNMLFSPYTIAKQYENLTTRPVTGHINDDT